MGAALQSGQFFGEVMRRREHGGIVLCELEHHTARKVPHHTHRHAYGWLLVRGACREVYATRQIEFRPLTVVFHPPDTSHCDEIGAGGGLFFVMEIPERVLECLRQEGRTESTIEAAGGDMTWLATRLFLAHHQGTADRLMAESAVLELVAHAARLRDTRERSEPAWMKRCMELLQAEYWRPLTVDEIAATLDLHPVYLSRAFRRRHGRTLGEFLNGVRVKRAGEQILHGRDLAAVAADCGFADQSHLTRVFKSLLGRPPGMFRRSVLV